MIIAGLKLTHDGAVALIEDGRLLFSIEVEKMNNNKRYTEIEDTTIIGNILEAQGYPLSSIDYFAVDGWRGYDQVELAIQPRLEIGDNCNRLSIKNNHTAYKLDIAAYQEKSPDSNILEEHCFNGLKICGQSFPYSGYLHAAGHIMSAYCTSPFSKNNESSYILVWDGGMYPLLYFLDTRSKKIENLGPIFLLIGNTYTIFSQHFGPFKVTGNFAKDSLSVAGKVMAYIALGKVREELFKTFDEIYLAEYNRPMGFANAFANLFKKRMTTSYPDEDVLRTFHAYLEKLLISKLAKKIARYPRPTKNICLVGGCALNIKWNSALRSAGLFEEVFVPPFPNDSGSAIGAACCHMWQKGQHLSLDWNVYGGPQIIVNSPAKGWNQKNCSIKELAEFIHEKNEPVVVLNDRAELGPRALGNRSILAPAVSPRMKDILNAIKFREDYRPVSPICLEDKAPLIFEPGVRDPFMLFDHRVKKEWLTRIPAVCHLDGTARLQTVNPGENPLIAELLSEYEKLSGIPLLCNTSANYKGSGFFPDILSASQWNRVNYLWCEQVLYEKNEKIIFSKNQTKS